MGRFMFHFLSSSQDDFKWGLGAMELQLSLKGTNGLCEHKSVFYDLKNKQRTERSLGKFTIWDWDPVFITTLNVLNLIPSILEMIKCPQSLFLLICLEFCSCSSRNTWRLRHYESAALLRSITSLRILTQLWGWHYWYNLELLTQCVVHGHHHHHHQDLETY